MPKRLTGAAAALLVLTLASSSLARDIDFLTSWWIAVAAAHHKLPEKLVGNLLKTESGNRHNTIRFGKLGSHPLYGPGGLNINCPRFRADPEACTDPYRNVWTTCEVLASLLKRKGSLRSALMTYNERFTEDYYRSVTGKN